MSLYGICEDAAVKSGSDIRRRTVWRCSERCWCAGLDWRVLVCVHQIWLTADLLVILCISPPSSMLMSGFCSCVCCDWCSKMFPKTSLTSLIVGVFLLYVLHTCWVMFGIVYTKPCEKPQSDSCISPYLAGRPRLQVRAMCHMWTFTTSLQTVHVKPGLYRATYWYMQRWGLLINK